MNSVIDSWILLQITPRNVALTCFLISYAAVRELYPLRSLPSESESQAWSRTRLKFQIVDTKIQDVESGVEAGPYLVKTSMSDILGVIDSILVVDQATL